MKPSNADDKTKPGDFLRENYSGFQVNLEHPEMVNSGLAICHREPDHAKDNTTVTEIGRAHV